MVEVGSLRRGLSEGVLIVVNVLLAFWIDAWWDGRRDAAIEATLVSNLLSETQSNRAELTRIIQANDQNLARVIRFVEATPDEVAKISGDSLAPIVRGFIESFPLAPHPLRIAS